MVFSDFRTSRNTLVELLLTLPNSHLYHPWSINSALLILNCEKAPFFSFTDILGLVVHGVLPTNKSADGLILVHAA